MHAEIMSSVKMKVQQNLLSHYLKCESCFWIPNDTLHQYITTDGEHLSNEEAAFYSKYLMKNVKNMGGE